MYVCLHLKDARNSVSDDMRFQTAQVSIMFTPKNSSAIMRPPQAARHMRLKSAQAHQHETKEHQPVCQSISIFGDMPQSMSTRKLATSLAQECSAFCLAPGQALPLFLGPPWIPCLLCAF